MIADDRRIDIGEYESGMGIQAILTVWMVVRCLALGARKMLGDIFWIFIALMGQRSLICTARSCSFLSVDVLKYRHPAWHAWVQTAVKTSLNSEYQGIIIAYNNQTKKSCIFGEFFESTVQKLISFLINDFTKYLNSFLLFDRNKQLKSRKHFNPLFLDLFRFSIPL